jgi:hypothetical protein
MFNRMGGVVLALPGPTVISKPLGLLLNLIGSWIGRGWFGFEYTYSEYYHSKPR